MSWIENMTLEETAVVEELKRRHAHHASPKMLEDEFVFHRFCKARDFNLEKAEIMLQNHIEWRKEFQVDSILEWNPPEVAVKFLPHYRCLSKEGRLVRYTNFGNFDMKGLHRSLSKSDILKYLIFISEEEIEMFKKINKKHGRRLDQAIYIHNYGNISFSMVTDMTALDVIISFTKVLQDHYPERVEYFFHVNVSPLFTLAYSVVKTFLAPALVEKFRFFGSDGWKEELLKLVDAEQLPAVLGGNTLNGTPLTTPFVLCGGAVPKSYYRKKTQKNFSKSPGVKTISLKPLSKKEIVLKLEKNQTLEWEFEINNRDINFGIHFRRDESAKLEKIIWNEKVDTDYGVEDGFYKCENSGFYVIEFDNSYSWMHPKEIAYRLRTKNPDDCEG